MLADTLKLSHRVAFEFFHAEDAALELYRVTPDWYYIVVACCFDHYADAFRVINRKAVTGRFADLEEGMAALHAMADGYDGELAAMLESEQREAEAEDFIMRRNDPFDPVYWE